MDTNDSDAGFEEGSVHLGKVVDQNFIEVDGNPTLELVVEMLGKLRDERSPGAGTDDCPRAERTILLVFDPAHPERLEWRFRDLRSLGFSGTDIDRLHPEHSDSFNLVGRSVYARMKRVEGREYW